MMMRRLVAGKLHLLLGGILMVVCLPATAGVDPERFQSELDNNIHKALLLSLSRQVDRLFARETSFPPLLRTSPYQRDRKRRITIGDMHSSQLTPLRVVGPSGMFRRFGNAPSPAPKTGEAQQQVQTGKNLILQVNISPQLAIAERDISWSVRPLDTKSKEHRLAGRSLRLALPVGRYEVCLQIGAYQERKQLQIAAQGVAKPVFSANIAQLRVNSKGKANWEVFQLQPNQPDKRLVSRNASDHINIIVPAGFYRVIATVNEASREQRLEVRRGESRVAQLNVPTGKVNLVATLANAPALKPIYWRVYRVDGGRRQQIAAPKQHSATLVVPPGHYEAVARLDGRERRRSFTVLDGTRNSIVLAMD